MSNAAKFEVPDSGDNGKTYVYSSGSDSHVLTSLAALYQPLDSDLTALAALTTTSFGRGLLELANAAALQTAAGLVIGTDVQAYSAVLAATTASFTTADETKLDGIEAGATADMSAAEILAALLTVDGAGSGLDADLLDGIEASGFHRVVTGLTPSSAGAASGNRTAIQAALDAAGALGSRTALSGGGTVTGVGRVQLAPVGLVWIDTTITVPNNVVLDLNGCRLTLAAGASTTVAPKSVVKFADNSSMAGVINGTLDANGSNQTDSGNNSHGLDFNRTGVGEIYDGCLFARDVMAVQATRGSGFNAAGSAVTAVLERCQAYFCRNGFWGKTDSEFIGCVSGNASWRGFHFYAGTSVLATACKSFGSGEADWSVSYCNNYSFVGCQSEDFGTLAGWVLTASNYISIKGGIVYRCALAGQQTALWIEDDTAGNECHHLDIDMTIDATSGFQPISYALTTRQLGEQCRLRLQVGTVGAVWQNLGGDGLEIADVKIGNEDGIQQIAYAASITPDPKAGGVVVVGTLTGDLTVNNPATAVPGTLLEFHLVQDGTGGRVVTWGAHFQAGATVASGPGARSVVQFRCVSPTSWRLVQAAGGGGGGDLLAANNLSDVASAATARVNLGVDYPTLDERTRDVIGTALVAGSNVTITPNDGADTITIAASASADTGAAPNALTGSPTLLAWYKADALSLSDGDAVATWTDSGPNGYNLTQGTSGSRPTYRAASGLNDQPAVQFDGTDDFVRNGSTGAASQTNITVVAVVVPTSNANMRAVDIRGSGYIDLSQNGAQISWQVGPPVSLFVASKTNVPNALFIMRSNGTKAQAFVNGHLHSYVETGSGAVTPGQIAIGNDNGTGQYWRGLIAEVIVYAAYLSQAQMRQVSRHLANKYGLPLGVITA